MTFDRFERLLEDLYGYYGTKCRKGDAAVKEYYQAIKFLPDAEVDFLYKTTVRNHKFFPTIPDLVEIANMKRQKTKLPENTQMCYCCMNTGMIPYFRSGLQPFPSVKYEFWASCPECDLGKRLALVGPWIPFNRLFDNEALETVRRENFQTYGSISESAVRRSAESVKLYVKRIAG